MCILYTLSVYKSLAALFFTTIARNDYISPIENGSTITIRRATPSMDLTFTANSDNMVEGNETFRLGLELDSGTLSSGQFLQSTLNVLIVDTTGRIWL